jgi:hypothetical protein
MMHDVGGEYINVLHHIITKGGGMHNTRSWVACSKGTNVVRVASGGVLDIYLPPKPTSTTHSVTDAGEQVSRPWEEEEEEEEDWARERSAGVSGPLVV